VCCHGHLRIEGMRTSTGLRVSLHVASSKDPMARHCICSTLIDHSDVLSTLAIET
jgi:hypothetical protein